MSKADGKLLFTLFKVDAFSVILFEGGIDDLDAGLLPLVSLEVQLQQLPVILYKQQLIDIIVFSLIQL